MSVRTRFLIKALAAAVVIAVAFLFFRPIVEVVTGVSSFLVSVLFLPAAVLVLAWFVFSVWGKAYLRAWHIRRIRNARDLREAIERGRHGG